jgi:hypothetical protein
MEPTLSKPERVGTEEELTREVGGGPQRMRRIEAFGIDGDIHRWSIPFVTAQYFSPDPKIYT